MTFESFCVGLIITLLILVITLFIGILLEDNNEDASMYGWMINGIGFGICLTIILYQNGVIK